MSRKGFFGTSVLAGFKSPEVLVPQCGACGLYKTCQSPKMEPSGSGHRKILIIAEAPGKDEDREGVQLVGKSGQYLLKSLRKVGVDMRKDCRLTNALICRPPKNEISDERMIDYCRPNLTRTLKEFRPEIIIPLGKEAVRSLVGGGVWKEDVGAIGRWVGWQIPCQSLNAWICPNFHPAYVNRTLDSREVIPQKYFLHYLKQAATLEGRPYEEVPDYKKQVECVYEPAKAAEIIREFVRAGGKAAFDYETDRLKPDHPDARIVSCSICWRGKRTIAYPWQGEAVSATQEFLKSDMPKIASNLKFEERWTRRVFGHGVTNWWRDTMLAAHVNDNRPEISSVKFQAFVLLGQESYDDHVKPFLKSKGKDRGANEQNRVRDIDLGKLLLYNGLDSLLEYKVAHLQLGG